MKQKKSKKTKEDLEKALKKEIGDIAENAVEQSGKDLTKYILIIGLIGPFIAIFQAVKIYTSQTAAGVSLLYWGGYLAIAGLWFGYGLYYKNKILLLTYGLWILVEIVILNGIYLYG